MRRLRDRLAVVFGGLMVAILFIIALNEENLLSHLLRDLQVERFCSAGLEFSERLGILVDAHAGRLEELDEAGELEALVQASSSRTPGELAELMARTEAERVVLTDPEGRVLLARPNDPLARVLGRQARADGRVRNQIQLLPDGLYMVSSRTFTDGERPTLALVLADRIGPDLLRRAAGEGDDLLVLTADSRVLELYVPPGGASGSPAELGRELASRLGSAPRVGAAWEISLGGRDYLVVAHRLEDPESGQPVALLWFGRYASEILAPVEGQRRRLLGLGLAGFLGVLAAAIALSGRITRPLEVLTRRMRRVGAGNLEPVEVRGRDEVAQLSRSFNEMTQGLRQKELLKRYVPVQARELIDADTEARVVLGGQRTRISVLYSDVRGFTALSERLDAAEVVSILNIYLDAMIGVLHAHRGDVSDYFGDAILAVFHDHDEPSGAQAVRAALAMQEELAFLAARSERAEIRGLRMGIGIHTGEAVEGNIGTAERLKYAVVGDTVNVGARIQDRSRDGRHTCVLLSSATRAELGPEFELDFFGAENLKGKTAPVEVWEVVRVSPPTPAPEAPELPARSGGATAGAPPGPDASAGGPPRG